MDCMQTLGYAIEVVLVGSNHGTGNRAFAVGSENSSAASEFPEPKMTPAEDG